MRAFVVLAVVVGAAFGAPTENSEVQRVRKGAYGVAPAFAPAPCAAGGPIAPIALYLSAAPGPIPTISHYREKENLHELEGNLEHHHQARSYYDGAASASAASAAAAIAAASAGAGVVGIPSAGPAAPAVGIFPGAKIGGCAVPLLLSCAPSVHSGHLAHTAYPSVAPAYRADADHAAKMREMNPEKQWTETEHVAKMREMVPAKTWAEAERASQMREIAPAKQWAEAGRASQMREIAPAKQWAEAERASQMREIVPPMNGFESARGAALTPMKMDDQHA